MDEVRYKLTVDGYDDFSIGFSAPNAIDDDQKLGNILIDVGNMLKAEKRDIPEEPSE